MNMSRVQLRSPTSVDGKESERCSSEYRCFSLNPAQRNILPHRQSQLSDLSIRLHITTSLKSISQIRWLYHQIFKWSFWPVQISQCQLSNQPFFVLIGQSPSADLYRYDNTFKKRLKTVLFDRAYWLIIVVVRCSWVVRRAAPYKSLIVLYCINHKYVNIHQLLILSDINNGWLMTVTVLQRKASTQ